MEVFSGPRANETEHSRHPKHCPNIIVDTFASTDVGSLPILKGAPTSVQGFKLQKFQRVPVECRVRFCECVLAGSTLTLQGRRYRIDPDPPAAQRMGGTGGAPATTGMAGGDPAFGGGGSGRSVDVALDCFLSFFFSFIFSLLCCFLPRCAYKEFRRRPRLLGRRIQPVKMLFPVVGENAPFGQKCLLQPATELSFLRSPHAGRA